MKLQDATTVPVPVLGSNVLVQLASPASKVLDRVTPFLVGHGASNAWYRLVYTARQINGRAGDRFSIRIADDSGKRSWIRRQLQLHGHDFIFGRRQLAIRADEAVERGGDDQVASLGVCRFHVAQLEATFLIG